MAHELDTDTRHHFSTLTIESRPHLPWLRFEGDIEDQFRSAHARSSFGRTRPILGLTAAAIIASVLWGMTTGQLSVWTAVYSLGLMLPTVLATLVLTYVDGRHAAYQMLLTVSGLLIGLVCGSLALRASMHGMSFFFAGELAWIFAVWLVLGLPLWHAAVCALAISASYVWGLSYWSYPPTELIFSSGLLLAVNMIGAYSCYALESAVRTAFRDNQLLREQAERDGLSGLYNRRMFDREVARAWRVLAREQQSLMLMLIDIDHFKLFNDLYGHQAGDDALKRVAGTIATYARRPGDFAARYGGEEFALVLAAPTGEYGREMPDELRKAVEGLKIPHAESSAGAYLTISIGVAIVLPGAERSLAGSIQMADEALSQAKEEGRNRVVVKESRHTHIQTGRFQPAKLRAQA